MKKESKMNNGDIIPFDSIKNFTYVKPLGKGGTSVTHLFLDSTTDMLFAIKKYSPRDKKFVDAYYDRFVDEIKILFNISHKNIVRIYNYYLYPNKKVGYLQMEFIEGKSIDQYKPMPWDKGWNEIFSETISAFEYLEEKKILHRDIRPANIMIDKNENVKIIDFGFGKQLKSNGQEVNSVLLNWPVTEFPDEILQNEEYNFSTEIYFVGNLYKHLLNDVEHFDYHQIIMKMIEKNPEQRYENFKQISDEIINGVLIETSFSDGEKQIYRDFADALTSHISNYKNNYKPINDIASTLSKLAEVIRSSSLEEYLQNNGNLISCFISGSFKYRQRKDIEIETIIAFYRMITRLQPEKQIILMNNIYTRLANIQIINDEDIIPF